MTERRKRKHDHHNPPMTLISTDCLVNFCHTGPISYSWCPRPGDMVVVSEAERPLDSLGGALRRDTSLTLYGVAQNRRVCTRLRPCRKIVEHASGVW